MLVPLSTYLESEFRNVDRLVNEKIQKHQNLSQASMFYKIYHASILFLNALCHKGHHGTKKTSFLSKGQTITRWFSLQKYLPKYTSN